MFSQRAPDPPAELTACCAIVFEQKIGRANGRGGRTYPETRPSSTMDDTVHRKRSASLRVKLSNRQFWESGGPRRIRTPDPLIRSQVLYPAELSVRVGEAVFRPGVRDVQPDSSKIIQKPISPRGSLISKTVPSGPVLVSTNSPPWPRTSSCEIARPRPEPPLRTPP